MPVNIGEINAILSAKDNMSEPLRAAAQRVKDLHNYMNAMGDESPEKVKAVVRAVAEAEIAFEKLRDSGVQAAAAIETIAPAAGTSAARLDELKRKTEEAAAASNVSGTEIRKSLEVQAAAANLATEATKRLTAARKEAADVAANGGSTFGALGAANSAALNGGKKPKTPKEDELSDQEYIDSLRQMSSAMTPLTAEQARWLQQLREMNMLTAANAEKVGVNVVQYKEFAGELRNTGTSARVAGQSLEQMQGMALRLIEYFAVSFAARGLVTFTIDLFNTADAMVNLHKQTDLTMEKIQQVKYAAEMTGGTFEKATGYINHMNAALGGMKGSTSDVLHEIGLSFSQIFALQPDQRFDTIAAAVAKIADPMERARIETVLFGSDAIDPMIMRLGELEKQAPILEDKTLNAMHNTTALYRGMWAEVGPILADWIEKGQKITELMASPIFGGAAPKLSRVEKAESSAFMGALSMIPGGQNVVSLMQLMGYLNGNSESGGGAGGSNSFYEGMLPADNAGKPPDPKSTPLMGQAYIDYLRSQSQEMKPLTDAQRVWLDQMRQMNVLTLDNATHLDVTTVQFKEYEKQVQKATAADKEHQKALEIYQKAFNDLNSTGDNWQDTLQGIDGTVVELGKSYLDSGGLAAMHDMEIVFGKDYGLTALQVKAIGEAWKYDQAQAKQFATDTEWAQKEVERATSAAAVATAGAVGGSFDRQRAAAQATFDIQEYLLGQRDISVEQYELNWAAYAAERDAKIHNIDVRQFEFEQRSLAELQVLWDQYYTAVEVESGNAADVQIANIRKQADAQIKAIHAGDPYGAEKLFAIEQIMNQRIQNVVRSFDPLWVAWKQGNEDMRHEWARTWDKGLSDTKYFVDALTKPLDDISTLFRRMISGVLADWEAKLLGPILQSTRNVIGQIFGTGPAGSGSAAMGGYAGMIGGAGSVTNMAGTDGNLSSESYIGAMYGYPSAGSGAHAGASSGQMAGGAMMAGAGIYQMYQNQNAMSDIMGGAMAGAGIGTMIMPGIGTAIGAAAGGVAGAIEALWKHFSDHSEEYARDGGRNYGQEWSDELIKVIEGNAKRFHDRVAGELASLPEMMAETPVNAGNLTMYESKVHDLFSMIDQGHMTIAEVTAELDKVFPQLANVAVDAYGNISDELRELIRLNRDFGTSSQAIADWQKGQGVGALTGFNAIEQGSMPGSKTELDDLGLQAVGSYVAAVATGTSKNEALKAQSAALTKLEKEYKDLGITVDDVMLKQLFLQNNMLKSTGHLSDGLEGLTKEMVNFGNLGIESADKFEAQQRTANAMHIRLQWAAEQAGGTYADSLRPMQDFLHAALIESEKLKLPLDANTQMMIDQSKELGIWDDKAGAAVDPTKDLAAAIHELVDWLKKIPGTVNTDVNVNTHHRDIYDDDTDHSGGNGESHADGGVIGGRVIPFRPHSTDTVVTALTPGEGVVTTTGMSRIGASGLAAINSGGSIGGDTYQINVEIHTNASNGYELAEAAKAPGGLIDIMIQEIARNKMSRGTKMKRAIVNAA